MPTLTYPSQELCFSSMALLATLALLSWPRCQRDGARKSKCAMESERKKVPKKADFPQLCSCFLKGNDYVLGIKAKALTSQLMVEPGIHSLLITRLEISPVMPRNSTVPLCDQGRFFLACQNTLPLQIRVYHCFPCSSIMKLGHLGFTVFAVFHHFQSFQTHTYDII